ncbi:capsid protein [Capybara virus 7_cap1_536]|nr:capsid protein [Capybara virus 7_cap1_536]QDJ95260.1 capsid protein [Capybara virus 27_cap1_2563]
MARYRRYRRRRRTKLRRGRRYRTVRRSYRRRRTGRYSYNKVYAFCRRVAPVALTSSNTGTQLGYTFALSTLPNYTEFTSLFDQYKIVALKVLFLPRVDNNPAVSTTTNFNPGNIYYAIDYDDSITTDVNAILQYQGHKIVRGDQPFSVYIRSPKVANAIYSGTAFTSYGNTTAWLDVASPSVPHYGLKLAWTSATDGVFTYDVTTMLYLRFKNVR